jgi:putative heme-binding domain-containing protein
MGRIYRIYHKDRPPRPIKRLDRLDTAGLVAALDSPNGPQRDLAMEMLIWKQDEAPVHPLRKLMKTSKRPETRLHALCTLDGLNGLDNWVVAEAADDSHPGVARHGIRLAPKWPDRAVGLYLFLEGQKRMNDHPQVRLQLAYTVGEMPTSRRWTEALAWLATKYGDDPCLLAAVLSSLSDNSFAYFTRVVSQDNGFAWRNKEKLLRPILKLAIAWRNHEALGIAFRELEVRKDAKPGEWQFECLNAALDSMDRNKNSPDKLFDPEQLKIIEDLAVMARKVVEDPNSPESLQLAGAGVLGRLPGTRRADIEMLGNLLTPSHSAPLQSIAITALARIHEGNAVAALLRGWKGHSPAIRTQILDALLSRDASLGNLLTALEKGPIQLSELDAVRRERLLKHKDKATRERAAKFLATSVSQDRKKVLDEYQMATTMTGNRARGKEVFAKRCATCHKLDGVGHDVGPDLGQMANKSPAAFLIAILDPNQAVDARYLQYLAATKDGRQYNGILANETATSITIREHDGKDWVLLRNELEALESTGKSLMPEGMEKDVNKQEMADLIAYLTSNAPPAKKVVGNQPVIVKQAADGSLRLLATNCEIHGGEITFESEFKNIGMWHGENDHVVWTVELDKPTSYDVYLDWACADSSARNVFVLEVAGKTLRHRVAGTGGDWSNYKLIKIGTITVRDGTQKLVVRPEAKPQGALCDLRALILVKEGGNEPKAGK